MFQLFPNLTFSKTKNAFSEFPQTQIFKLSQNWDFHFFQKSDSQFLDYIICFVKFWIFQLFPHLVFSKNRVFGFSPNSNFQAFPNWYFIFSKNRILDFSLYHFLWNFGFSSFSQIWYFQKIAFSEFPHTQIFKMSQKLVFLCFQKLRFHICSKNSDSQTFQKK